MSDTYKLVFRGEVLEGQHPAVVRKRLAEAAGFADAQLDKLFSGRPVVVKREADTATAARYQAVFRKAGARLRVLPVETEDDAVASVPAAGTESAPSAPGAAAANAGTAPAPGAATPAAAPDPAAGGFEVLPAGSDLLAETERTPFVPRDVDTGGLALEGARFVLPDSGREAAADAPDVSHLSLAEAGVDLAPVGGAAAPDIAAPDFDVAEAGAELGPGAAAPAPVIDLSAVTFEVAPAGSDLGQRKGIAPPPAPDTSHLTLE